MSSYSSETFSRMVSKEADGDGDAHATSSIALSVATLLKNMIGAGIFSLPIGLWHATLLPGLGTLALIGFLSAGSYWMIGYCCITWKVKTFRDLWNRVLGKGSAWVIDATIFLNGWFTLVCYLVLIGDFTTKSFEGLLGEGHLLARSRALNQWVVTLVVLLPLSLAKDLRKLAFTSILGLCALMYTVVLVLEDFWMHTPDPNVVLSEWRMGCFEAVALYTHAFVAHYNAPKVFSELVNPTHRRWAIFVAIAYTIAFLVYSSFAWAGFRRFGSLVEGNILRNYEPHLNVLIAWLVMGFSIAFTYPLVFNSMREAALNLFVPVRDYVRSMPRFRQMMASPRMEELRRSYISRRTAMLDNIMGPSPEAGNKKIHGKPGRRTTVALVLLTACVAMQLDDVGVVNALAGAIMGCMVCFVLPGALFTSTARLQLRMESGAAAAEGAGQSSSLVEPLLQNGSRRAGGRGGGATRRLLLRLAIAAGAITSMAGVAFTVIGTGVILLRL